MVDSPYVAKSERRSDHGSNFHMFDSIEVNTEVPNLYLDFPKKCCNDFNHGQSKSLQAIYSPHF